MSVVDRSALNMSKESFEALEAYQVLLVKWQKAVNLVSPKTIDDSWQRHFIDSAQLSGYIEAPVKVVADIGSGAGFPGMVLHLIRSDLEVHMVESDMKKCQFLSTVAREAGSRAHIHNMRIEDSYGEVTPDLITARALASLEKLFDLVLPWAEANPDLGMLFLKGARAQEEIDEALKRYDFEYEIYKSVTDAEARILRIHSLRLE